MALELVKLDSATLPGIADAIREKRGGTDLMLPSEMRPAILAIPTGAALPELTDPAEVGHVVAGKEYIDGNGNKRAGTLVVCDTIEEVETIGVPGTGVSVYIESTADGSSKVITLPEPALKPENIKSGISIFGIQGSLVGGGAKEPYIEETYNADGELIDVNLVGYTVIRRYAFYGCTNLALTSLPSGITSIGYDAFYGCRNLALTNLPSGITSIENEAFQNCQKLALTSLPSGLTEIGSRTFSGCPKLALTSIPSGITSIGAYAFRDCTGLTSITFHGKPRTITANAFNGCTNLKTINVPWARGEVANAPWGATNATINYNYTG